MDHSKLPKLSGDQPQQPVPNQTPGEDVPVAAGHLRDVPSAADYGRVPPSGGAEAWVSIGIAAILLFMNPQFIKYLLGQPINTALDLNGQPRAYVGSFVFMSDLSITLFAIALILEGMMYAFVRRANAVVGVMGFTGVATVANLYYLITSYRHFGLPLISAFAVVFGVYMLMNQWRLFQLLRRARF